MHAGSFDVGGGMIRTDNLSHVRLDPDVRRLFEGTAWALDAQLGHMLGVQKGCVLHHSVPYPLASARF